MEGPPGYVMPYEASSYYPVEKCRVELKNKTLWAQFHQLQTEMIITKSGRRMFPSLHVDMTELDPQASYCVFLEMSLQSHCRYKYSSSVGWTPAGNEEAQSPNRLYMHPQSPSTGEHWMSQTVSFSRLKLTNTSAPPQGHLVLSSMHRYQPRILIVKSPNPTDLGWAPSKIVVFPETQFIAVTAYQNDKITKLKIDHNPFAKGFRENGKSSTNKRKHAEINVVDVDVDSTPKEILTHCPNEQKKREFDAIKVNVEGEPIMYKTRMQPPLVPLYGYCYPPFPVYSSPMWTSHIPYYHHQYPLVPPPSVTRHHHIQTQPQDLSMSHNIHQDLSKKPVKKVTDFSIRKITGCS